MDIFVVDTSALILDLDLFNKLSFCKIIIHTTVLEELDNLSKKNNSKGANARRVLNKLFELRNRGNFYNGIKVKNKIIEISDIEPKRSTYLRFGFSEDKKDNLLLCVTREIKDSCEDKVIFLTADRALCLKASIDLEVEYLSVQVKKRKHKNKDYYNNQLARLK